MTATPATRLRLPAGTYRPWLVLAVQGVFSRVFRLLFELRVEGRDRVPGGGVILAGNHTSWLDGPLVFLYHPGPLRFLTKAEVFAQPVAGRALGWLGQIPVHRGQPDRAALRTALDVLAAGGAVGVFPEGTRGPGDLASVHHGVAYLAVKSGCPVVPVTCVGSVVALPPGRWLPRPRTRVRVRYGEPVRVRPSGAAPSRQAVGDAAEHIRAALAAHVAAAHGKDVTAPVRDRAEEAR